MNFLSFANPGLLWLLPLCLAPVLFHLFMRIRRQTVRFSTLMFFERIDPRLSSRRRIIEWLLLLLRVLALAMLIVALSAPTIRGAVSTDPSAVVILIDNSGSMSNPIGKSGTRLKAALTGASRILSTLKPGDTAGIVLLCDDPSVPLPDSLTSDKEVIRSILGRVTETEATGSAARALKDAATLLRGSVAADTQLHILTDLQREEWARTVSKEDHGLASTQVMIHVFPAPNRSGPNVVLESAGVPTHETPPNRPVSARVRLANRDNAPATVSLNYVDDSGQTETRDMILPPGGGRDFVFLTQPLAPGIHWMRMWIEGDSFSADNSASLAIVCGERKRVAFLGKRRDFGMLPLAIAPAGDGSSSGIQTIFADSPAAFIAEAESPDTVLLVTSWHSMDKMKRHHPETSKNLKRIVESGKCLLVAPSPDDMSTEIDVPDWTGAVLESFIVRDDGSPALAIEPDPLISVLESETDGKSAISSFRVFKSFALRLAPGGIPLLGLDTGECFLSRSKVGAGSVIACGCAFQQDWSNLPLKGGFVVLAQEMPLQTLDTESTPSIQVSAGRRVQPPESSPSDPVSICTIQGRNVEWTGPGEKLPAFPGSGVYLLTAGSNTTLVSVRSSIPEGADASLDLDAIPALNGLSWTARPYDDGKSIEYFLESARRSSRLSGILLLAAVLLLACESLLANRPPLTSSLRRDRPLFARLPGIGALFQQQTTSHETS